FMAFLRLLPFFLLAIAARPALGHPAHAEEVSHPFIAGFERFFAEDDAPAYLRQGGELLLSELNCVACHEPPVNLRNRLPKAPGPDLRGIASRISDPSALQIIIRNPRYLKRGTRMPSLFAASDRDPEELDALFHFLLSQRTEAQEPLLLGIPERGMELYHTVGCVGCHAPDVEYRPRSLAEDAVQEPPALPSLPIRLAAYWSADHLTRYLMNPAEHHPGTRMPDSGLSEQEAADIAAYLQAGPEVVDPTASHPEADLALVDQGRKIFRSKGCVACHDLGLSNQAIAPPLTQLRTEDVGCLAELPTKGGVPYFYLGSAQRTAIKLALSELGSEMGQPLTRELMRWDCFACHTLDGRGGPETSREPYFGAGNPYALDREHFLPPSLDDLDNRRSREDLEAIFSGTSQRRYPQVQSRMIRVEPALQPALIELLIGQSR
ncbi:MAG: c-type cytochrome, partial [Verrucomicrobiota bacterium]